MNVFRSFFLGIQKLLRKVLPKVHIVAASSPFPVPHFPSAAHVAPTGLQLSQTARYRHLVDNSGGGYCVGKCCLSIPCSQEKANSMKKLFWTISNLILWLLSLYIFYLRVFVFVCLFVCLFVFVCLLNVFCSTFFFCISKVCKVA